MQRLTESEFLTVDLKSLFTNANSSTEHNQNKTENGSQSSDTNNSNSTETGQEPQNTGRINWEKELNKRLTRNKALSPEARESDYDVEKRFWQEYFTAEWKNPDDVRLLMSLGIDLRHDIKALGINKNNPIIAFLKQRYVKEQLLRTKLLNSYTYQAISEAVQKKYVADTEFFYKKSEPSDYNIIYCRDLYTKSKADMIKYLEIQGKTLKISQNKYTVEVQNNNKSVFLQILKDKFNTKAELASAIRKIPKETLAKVSVKSKNAKLNSLEVVKELTNFTDKLDIDNSENKKPADVESLANKLDSPAKVLACMQYLSMTTGSEEAQKAMSHPNLANVSLEELKKATSDIAKLLAKVTISKNKVKELVALLLND